MSQIDQAFLRAFETEAVRDAPAPTGPMSAVSPAGGPHFSGDLPVAPPVLQYSLQQESDPYTDELARYNQSNEQPQTIPVESVEATPVVADTTGQRRPLSSFAAPSAAPSEPSFRPVFEVDAFRWPTTCSEMLREYEALFEPVVRQLLAAGEAGRSMVGVFGTRLGVGCTTMLLCLAKSLAKAGKNVAIVDADFSTAQLGRRLGLEVETGWEDVLSGSLPLAECVVQSIDDRIALLPLVKPSSSATELLASIHASVSAGMLRYQFDLVLFDLGTACHEPQATIARTIGAQCRLDSCMAITEATSQPTSLTQIGGIADSLGAECLGVIENQIRGGKSF